MTIGIACATCAFFQTPRVPIRGRTVFGQCRRHAPTLDFSEGKPRSIWPLVADDAWRGEHATLDTEE